MFVAAALLMAGVGVATRAEAALPPQVAQIVRLPMADGVELEVNLGGRGPLVNGQLPARPVIAEFSPYGPGCCSEYGGPDFNYLQVHIRGTGDSDGAFDALGNKTQNDMAAVLKWACTQPWSNGRIGLYGFSASAIAVYNSLHNKLPCVQAAVLGAGTHELYRDLMYPGGIPNMVPAVGVLGLISAPLIAAGQARVQRGVGPVVDAFNGMFATGVSYLQHPTLDAWWRERGMRGNANSFPILMVTGFYDVESRGPFEVFKELRGTGSHLYVVGAHDGTPVGTDGMNGERNRWYQRFLRDARNGVDTEPAVKLWMSDGDREDMLAGKLVTSTATDWPVPGTRWASLFLGPGSLRLQTGPVAKASYVEVGSLPTATDPHTTSLLGQFNNSPQLTDMTTPEKLGLSFTTAPLKQSVVAAGPAALEVVLASTSPQTDMWAVISDVSPDGVAHPVATGRLRTAYPYVDRSRSLTDNTGAIVEPYGRYEWRDSARIGEARRYHVEFWPIGNRFRAGHRIRLHVLGASAFSAPGAPALNTVTLGGTSNTRLLLPVLPGSDIATALR